MRHFHLILLPLIVGVASALDVGASGSRSDDSEFGDGTRIVPVDGGTYTSVEARRLASMLERKDFRFVNVHVPYAGEIEQTDAFVPFNQVEQNISSFPADKDARIVLYCRSEGMGITAATELVRLGYTDVWNVEGGMNAWTASGGKLLDTERDED